MKLLTPLTENSARELKAGDIVKITGYIYTARDAAHKRMTEAAAKGESLPFDPKNQIIYYVGPTPAKPGQVIGSAGPTTSGRMDPYAPLLLDMGLSAMIGKGERKPAVVDAIKRNGAVYFCAIGGCGALACQCITECEVIAFEDLGCESVKKLTFDKFPLIVAIDAVGGNIFETGRNRYAEV